MKWGPNHCYVDEFLMRPYLARMVPIATISLILYFPFSLLSILQYISVFSHKLVTYSVVWYHRLYLIQCSIKIDLTRVHYYNWYWYLWIQTFPQASVCKHDGLLYRLWEYGGLWGEGGGRMPILGSGQQKIHLSDGTFDTTTILVNVSTHVRKLCIFLCSVHSDSQYPSCNNKQQKWWDFKEKVKWRRVPRKKSDKNGHLLGFVPHPHFCLFDPFTNICTSFRNTLLF